MRTPRFLSVEDILYVHQRALLSSPGEPLDLLDLSKLEAALAMPMQTAFGEFVHHDFFEMAAAYCFHLTMAHAFLAGNKRVGARAAIVFLHANGINIHPDPVEYAALVLRVVEGSAGKSELTEFFANSPIAQ